MLTSDPFLSGVARSTSLPSISAITAAFARPLPISEARSAPVEPFSKSLLDPSGRVTEITGMNVCYRSPLTKSVNI